MQYNYYGGQYNPYQQKQNLEWIMVPSVQDVDKVSVQPGQKAWVMVQNEAVFALRTADQMGLVQTDLYSFQRYEPKEPAQAPGYVTREEFEKTITELTSKLGGAKREPNTKRDDKQQ